MRNTSWLDNQAVQWLKKHKNQAVVIDADQSLGDVLMPASWISSELKRLLDEGTRSRIPPSVLPCMLCLGQRCATCTRRLHHQITQSFIPQTRYFQAHREGSFRLRVKLHKNPIVGRPIANTSWCWVVPACLFLCNMLQPIQDELRHTVHSSKDFLSNHLPKSAPPNYSQRAPNSGSDHSSLSALRSYWRC